MDLSRILLAAQYLKLKFQARLPSISMDENGGSFLRFAFINMLLDIVYRSKDPRVILDGLRVVCQDTDFTDSVASDIRYYSYIT